MHSDLIHVSANMWPSSRRHNTKAECIQAEITEVSEAEVSVRSIHSNTTTCLAYNNSYSCILSCCFHDCHFICVDCF